MIKLNTHTTKNILLPFLVLLTFSFGVLANAKNHQNFPVRYQLISQQRNIFLEEANTPQQWRLGLMNRKSMPVNHGMLFSFPTAQVRKFWMKNTLIPIDIIFLYNKKIVGITKNALPCPKDFHCPSYGPNKPSNQVIELNAGKTDELELNVNQVVILHKIKSKSNAVGDLRLSRDNV